MPIWDFSPSSSDVVYGTNAGNLFIIESWMDGNWFKNLAPNATDMFGLIQSLNQTASGSGSGNGTSPETKAEQALRLHYDQWITESDIAFMSQARVNHLRIPLGWWSFIPSSPEDGWQYVDDLYYLNRLLGWLYKYNMYAILDMHSMPGGQSGDATTGRAQGTQYQFFSPANQQRGDQVIQAVRDFILTSEYGRTVSSVLVVNEPCVNTDCAAGHGDPSHYPVLVDFYSRSYSTLSQAGIPMMFHHGWAQGNLGNWTSFVKQRDPAFLIASDNPYPGSYPSVSNETELWSHMCYDVNTFRQYPTKVISTEWSLSSGMPSNFSSVYYNSQAYGYSLAGGACFWSYKVLPSSLQPAPQSWSWKTLWQQGVVPNGTISGSDKDSQFASNKNAHDFLANLPNKHVCKNWG